MRTLGSVFDLHDRGKIWAVRVLLTNDDGVGSPGIHAIAVALDHKGHDVVVAAPTGERSGWSAGLGTLNDGVEIAVEGYAIPGHEAIPAWAIDGPPAFCVLVGMLKKFGPAPDLVVSGINNGTNCGRGILHSGTVGGAMIAQNFGLSGLAISQHDDGEPMNWSTGAAVALATVDWLESAPRKTLLNVNVPNVALQDILGARWARLAALGSTTTSLVGDVPGTMTVRVKQRDSDLEPGTDTALVADGYVTISGLTGFRAASGDLAASATAIEAALS